MTDWRACCAASRAARPTSAARARPEVRADELGDAPQHDVACLVSVGVVDLLEVVDVDECDGQGSVVPARPLDFVEEGDQQRLPVGDAGQAVGVRLVVGLSELQDDRVDRLGHPSTKSVAGRVDAHPEVSGGDPFGGGDDRQKADPDIQPEERGRERYAKKSGTDGRDDDLSGNGSTDDRGANQEAEQGKGNEQGQSPDGALHTSKGRGGCFSDDRTGGTTPDRRKSRSPKVRAGPRRSSSTAAGPGRLVYSAGPRTSPARRRRRSLEEGVTFAP